MADNKFSRYLMYAAGEIILVFIGILIALQVNNGNEIRKKEQTAKEILKQIQKDIITSVEEADAVIEYYRVLDSLTFLVLSGKVTADDYLSNGDIIGLTMRYYPFYINDYAFKKLDQYLDYMPEGTESLKKELYFLYTYLKRGVEEANIAISEESNRNNRMFSESKTWRWKLDFFYGLGNEEEKEALNEASDYFLTDPFYKNYLHFYSVLGSDNLCYGVKEFRTKAIRIYNEIAKALESENSSELLAFPYYLDIDNYKSWLGNYGGNYMGKEYSIEITIDDGTLFGQLRNDVKREILPLSGTEFYLDGQVACFSLITNEDSHIAGIQCIHWRRCLDLKKIE